MRLQGFGFRGLGLRVRVSGLGSRAYDPHAIKHPALYEVPAWRVMSSSKSGHKISNLAQVV